MTRAAIYARYSSHAQNDESIEQQLAECERYAADHALSIVATYADRAISGRSDKRPEFQKMIRAAEAGDFAVVIAYKSNRIARNMLHALQYEARLDKCGVRVVYCKEEFGDTATGRFMLRSMMNLNQFYSENMSEDIKRGMDENARKCRINGLVPLGYKRGDEGRYAIDEKTAPVVLEIFHRIDAGERYSEIAEDLNRRHIPTASGSEWGEHSFSHLVSNERYAGVYLYNGIRIEGGVPALVPRDLFDRVNDRASSKAKDIVSRRRTEGVHYMLSGKLFCGDCRSRMTGVSGKGKSGQPYRYYLCKGCGHTRIRKDYIEPLIFKTLRDFLLSDENIDKMVDMVMQYKDDIDKHSEADAIAERLRETRKAKDNLIKVLESGVTSRTITDRLNALERTEFDLEGLLAAEQRKTIVIDADAIRFFFVRFREGDANDPKYQRLLIDTFLRAAYVYPDRITLCFTFDDADLHLDVPIDDGGGVSLTEQEGHHIPLKLTLRMIGRVFVLTVKRDK